MHDRDDLMRRLRLVKRKFSLRRADTLLDFLSSLTRSRDQKIVHIDLASMVKNALKFDA